MKRVDVSRRVYLVLRGSRASLASSRSGLVGQLCWRQPWERPCGGLKLATLSRVLRDRLRATCSRPERQRVVRELPDPVIARGRGDARVRVQRNHRGRSIPVTTSGCRLSRASLAYTMIIGLASSGTMRTGPGSITAVRYFRPAREFSLEPADAVQWSNAEVGHL
jgi:hypothetical protein